MSESEKAYVVAGCKPWNKRLFEERIAGLPGHWSYVDGKDELNTEFLQSLSPKYIFFLHWSWMVPKEVFEVFECTCFHMTDVPYGRGGSPLQNLIARGHESTMLSALRMVEDIDAGPVYFKQPLPLHGTAEEIYIRTTELAAEMIKRMVVEEPDPVPQFGEVTPFKRRTPKMSRIPHFDTLSALHDFLRMLDAESYPHAFLEHKGFRYHFRRAALYDDQIRADVEIVPIDREEE